MVEFELKTSSDSTFPNMGDWLEMCQISGHLGTNNTRGGGEVWAKRLGTPVVNMY